MKGIFQNYQDLEKRVKDHYSIPDFLMMENAATAICNLIYKIRDSQFAEKQSEKNKKKKNEKLKILILCGKGNNGGDGFAVARKLQDDFEVQIHAISEPKTFEAKKQFEMCQKLGIDFISNMDFEQACKQNSAHILLDCLYGTGFHGELNEADRFLLSAMNSSSAVKIACDIPSALFFNADYTVTMGELKIELFSDKAKSVCGKIIAAPLGISNEKFSSLSAPIAFLLEKSDIILPIRKNKSAHKGNFGHAVTIVGEKAGAGIIGATAALNFGAGFSTLFQADNSNLNQFKISPELMLSKDAIPEKATSIQIGSGLGKNENAIRIFERWFSSAKNPACVIDADLFSYDGLKDLLCRVNQVSGSRIVLTPHPTELQRLSQKLGCDFSSNLEIADYFFKNFKNITLVMKGANTFIASEGNIFVCADGNQSLAKAGSGDVLAGLINGLLAQGFSGKNAAITAVMVHALISSSTKFKDSFFLTPEKLLSSININQLEANI